MRASPRISVSIVNYNFGKYIGPCIESVLNQTLKPFEIIITDDCSQDDSWAVIASYQERYPDVVKAVRQGRNMGPYFNGTLGYKLATGDFLSAIDGDDLWHPEKLAQEWQVLQDNPGYKIAYSNVQIIDGANTIINKWVKPGDPAPPEGDVFARVFAKRFFNGRKSVFRNELIARCVYDDFVHDKNVLIHLDWDFKVRATSKYLVGYTGKELVQYRDHGGGISKTGHDKLYTSAKYIINKNLHLLEGRPEPEVAYVLQGLNELMLKLAAGSNQPAVQFTVDDIKPIEDPNMIFA